MARSRNKTVAVGLIVLTAWLMPSFTASASTTKRSAPSAGVTFRAVLCYAPLAPAKPPFSKLAALPECKPKYQLTAKNIGVNPDNSASGFKSNDVKPDPRFLNFPDSSSAVHSLTSNLLLSGLNANSKERYVVGPARLTSASIKSAKAVKQSGQWVVTFTLTTQGSARFDALAKSQFHAYVAIVANGDVYSAPIMQPTSRHFSSFSGSGEVSGGFTKSQAQALAKQMLTPNS